MLDKDASTPVAHNATCYGRELAIGDAMNAHHALHSKISSGPKFGWSPIHMMQLFYLAMYLYSPLLRSSATQPLAAAYKAAAYKQVHSATRCTVNR